MAWGSTGTSVCTSKQSASSILFARPGSTTVRQWEVVTTTEIRALAESTAKDAVPDTAQETASVDNTVQTEYYASIGGRTYAITATTGSKTVKGASRRDESGQWMRTDTYHEYFVTGLDTNVWGTTELDADGNAVTLTSGGTEVVVGYDRTTSRVAWDVFSQVSTTVKEYRNIDTKAHAEAIVNSNSSNGTGTNVVYHHQTLSLSGSGQGAQDMVTAWVTVPSGTDKFASARYCGASQGWTVTVTIKQYSWTSPTAATSGDGWRDT